MIKLICQKCGGEYQKPTAYKKIRNVFFKFSLTFCDNCRKKKEIETIKKLPGIIKILSNEL